MSDNIDALARTIACACLALCPGQAQSQAAASNAITVGFIGDNGQPPPRVESPEYPYLIADPLATLPKVPAMNSQLGGDPGSARCASDIDLTHPISLGEAIDAALCRNPQVQEAWAAIKLQSAALGQARAAWLPTASATVSELSNRVAYPGAQEFDSKTSGHTVYGALTWRLFDFGARSANNEAATRTLESALAAHDAALQKALSGVVEAYFDAVTAKAAYNARSEATRFAEQTLQATQRRESRNVAPASDTLQAKVALAKGRLAEQRALGDYQKAVSMLLYATGLPAEGMLELADDVEMPHAEAVTELSQWLEETKASHPAIVAARAQVAAAKAKVQSVRSQGMPTIDFNGNYYQNGYPNQGLQPTRSNTTTLGVTLTIPLFEGFARTYQVRSAQAQVEQSEAQLRDVELQTLTAVVKDHADASAALANLDSSSAWLSAANEAIASSRRRYDKGDADILELLASESQLTDALQERVRCVSEWRSARLRLLADAGRLQRSDVR
jgi:outer membrane protein